MDSFVRIIHLSLTGGLRSASKGRSMTYYPCFTGDKLAKLQTPVRRRGMLTSILACSMAVGYAYIVIQSH